MTYAWRGLSDQGTGRVVGPAHLMEWFLGPPAFWPADADELFVGYPVDAWPPTEVAVMSGRRRRWWWSYGPAERYLVQGRQLEVVDLPDDRWPPNEPSDPVVFERSWLGAEIWNEVPGRPAYSD